jgi:hypothetical protein
MVFNEKLAGKIREQLADLPVIYIIELFRDLIFIDIR